MLLTYPLYILQTQKLESHIMNSDKCMPPAVSSNNPSLWGYRANCTVSQPLRLRQLEPINLHPNNQFRLLTTRLLDLYQAAVGSPINQPIRLNALPFERPILTTGR